MGFFGTPNLSPCGNRFYETYWLQCIWQKSSIHTITHPGLMFLALVYTQVHGFFRNQTVALTSTDSVRPIDYSVSDSRVVFVPAPTPYSCSLLSHSHRSMEFCDSRVVFVQAPTPYSCSSLSHAHRFIGFFHNQTFTLAAKDSVRPIDYSVSDRRVVSTPSIST